MPARPHVWLLSSRESDFKGAVAEPTRPTHPTQARQVGSQGRRFDWILGSTEPLA